MQCQSTMDNPTGPPHLTQHCWFCLQGRNSWHTSHISSIPVLIGGHCSGFSMISQILQSPPGLPVLAVSTVLSATASSDLVCSCQASFSGTVSSFLQCLLCCHGLQKLIPHDVWEERNLSNQIGLACAALHTALKHSQDRACSQLFCSWFTLLKLHGCSWKIQAEHPSVFSISLEQWNWSQVFF